MDFVWEEGERRKEEIIYNRAKKNYIQDNSVKPEFTWDDILEYGAAALNVSVKNSAMSELTLQPEWKHLNTFIHVLEK